MLIPGKKLYSNCEVKVSSEISLAVSKQPQNSQSSSSSTLESENTRLLSSESLFSTRSQSRIRLADELEILDMRRFTSAAPARGARAPNLFLTENISGTLWEISFPT